MCSCNPRGKNKNSYKFVTNSYKRVFVRDSIGIKLIKLAMKFLKMTTTQNHKFKLTLLGLVMQGMGLMAHAAPCGTPSQSGTDYTFSADNTMSCEPDTNVTNVTVSASTTQTSSGNSVFNFYIPSSSTGAYSLTSFSNSGTIDGLNISAIYIDAYARPASIDLFTNSTTGVIKGLWAFDIETNAQITKLDNYGSISGQSNAFGIWGGVIGELNNYKTIEATGGSAGAAINLQYGQIQTINNYSAGVIQSPNDGIFNGGSIGTITNQGLMLSSTYGIYNAGTIGTLNNAQGAITTSNTYGPLKYYGPLPTHYNIIITSLSNYGKLEVTQSSGNTTFGISSLSTKGNSVLGSYSSIITGVSSSQLGLTGTTATGTSNGYGYTLTESVTTPGSEVWDLTITSAPAPIITGPSAADTQASLVQSAAVLRTVYNQQTSVINNSLNYHCTSFAANGVCVSGGGRVAKTDNISGSTTSTLLVATYKALSNLRVGAFVDQNVASSNITGISMDKSPMYGVFGVWNQNPDATGYEVRLSSGWSNQNVTQTRNVVGSSEAGVGSATLTSQALSAVVSYVMPVIDSAWIASPYLGVRKTKINRGSYTETSAVTAPLTYSDLRQDITTALAGVRMIKKFGNDLYFTGSVGVEQNIGSNINTLDATGVTGLTSTDFTANYAKTRPVASVGVNYAVAKDQRISFGAMYRKEPFQSAGSTTAMLMYQVGL